MKTPKTSLKSTLSPKISLPETAKDFEVAAEKVETAYPTPPIQQQISRLTVEIPAELLKKIKIRCAKSGQKIKSYVVEVLERAEAGNL